MVAENTIEYATAAVVLGVAIAVACTSSAVLRYYASVLRQAPRRDGLLLWHIVAIASAVTGTWVLLGFGQLDILDIVETPRWVRLIGYTCTGVLTVVAIGIIAVEQRRRVRSPKPGRRRTGSSNPMPTLLARLFAPWLSHPDRINNMEATVAADTEMIARLNTASSKVATKLHSLLDKVDALDSSIAADAQADADALRPSVEFLENLGADEATPVPSTDPVPSEPTPEPAPADGGNTPVGPAGDQPA